MRASLFFVICAAAIWAQPASSIDLSDPTQLQLVWAPAARSPAGYVVYAEVNDGPLQVIGSATSPSIHLQGLSFQTGDEIVVYTQAFGAALDRGPLSPPSDRIRFVSTPVWGRLPDLQLTEGVSVSVPISATLSSGAPLRLSSPSLPRFAYIQDFGDGTGLLLLSPRPGDAGSYRAVVNATDLGPPLQSTASTVNFYVSPPTPAPQLFAVPDQSVSESHSLTIRVSGSLPVIGSSPNLPSFVSLVNRSGGIDLVATPGFDDAGTYPIRVDARTPAGTSLAASQSFTLTVRDLNRRPVLSVPTSLTAVRGQPLSFTVLAFDADLDPLTFVARVGGRVVAFRATNLQPSAAITIPASETQGGDFSILVYVYDTKSGVDSVATVVSVVSPPPPVAPVLTPLAHQNVTEGDELSFDVSIDNASAGSYSLFATGLPPFAQFSDLGNGLGRLSVKPRWGDRGFFDVLITAQHDLAPQIADSRSLRVTVDEVRVVTGHDIRDEVMIFDPVTLTGALYSGGTRPLAIAKGPQGRVFALRGSGHTQPEAVLEIDVSTGATTTLTQRGYIEALSYGPTQLTVGNDGMLYVTVAELAPAGPVPRIVRVDPDTGQQQLIHRGSPVVYPLAIAMGPDDRLYIGDLGARGVIAIDLVTGTAAVIATIDNVSAIVAHDSGRLILGQGFGPVGTGSLWWLDPSTGELELLTDANLLGHTSGIAAPPGGDLTVTSANAPGLVRIDPTTGAQTAWPLPGAGHFGIAVVPAP